MNKENINRLKKYIFFVSLFFCLILGSHLSYLYIYDKAKETPLEGGSISEGIIGDFPNLNPLLNNSDYNKNIIYNLYRGLLKYSETEKKFIPDLAKCNLSDLANIECVLDINAKWSSGEQIKNEDVINTFTIIQNSDINVSLKSSLKNTQITEKNGKIVFISQNRNINILPVLTQAIVNKEYINNIGNKELYGKFNPIGGVYSGPYMIDTMSYDDALGIQKLILIKNPFYSQENIYIQKYIYKFFDDVNKFIKNKDSVNIFNDVNKNYNESSSRFEKYDYSLNQFVGLFINEDKISQSKIREFVLSQINIDEIIKNFDNTVKKRENLLGIKEETKYSQIDISKELEKIGYYKKDLLQKKLLENKIKEENKKINVTQNYSLKYISGKINKKYNFVNISEITLNGKVNDKNPEAVYINGYKLSSYKKGQKDFVYKLSSQFKNINPGDNKYTVEFEIKGKKEKVEEFNIYFNKDNTLVIKKQEELNKKIEEEKLKNTTEITLDKKTIEKIQILDDKYFYNKDYKKYSINLNYIGEQKIFEDVFNFIKSDIEKTGIEIIGKSLKLSELSNIISENKKDYDMILVGIDLGYFDYNLYSYFHSTQTNLGFNFSNIKIKDIDTTLEKLNSKLYDKKETEKDKIKLNRLIKERYIYKTIYQNKKSVYIDKNIKNISILPEISSDIHIQNRLREAYITSLKEINYSTKSIKGFYDFLISILKNEN